MEKWRLKLTSAKVEVEVEAELGKNIQENITFSLSNYPPLGEMSVFRALDVYKHPYSYFDCNWRDKKIQ